MIARDGSLCILVAWALFSSEMQNSRITWQAETNMVGLVKFGFLSSERVEIHDIWCDLWNILVTPRKKGHKFSALTLIPYILKNKNHCNTDHWTGWYIHLSLKVVKSIFPSDRNLSMYTYNQTLSLVQLMSKHWQTTLAILICCISIKNPNGLTCMWFSILILLHVCCIPACLTSKNTQVDKQAQNNEQTRHRRTRWKGHAKSWGQCNFGKIHSPNLRIVS